MFDRWLSLRKSTNLVGRLNDNNNSFENLKRISKINSSFLINDDWYMINDEYFQLEFTDTDSPDVSYFIIYAEVTLEDGNVIRTLKILIYNK